MINSSDITRVLEIITTSIEFKQIVNSLCRGRREITESDLETIRRIFQAHSELVGLATCISSDTIGMRNAYTVPVRELLDIILSNPKKAKELINKKELLNK